MFNGQVYKIFYNSGYTCVAFPKEIRIVKDTLKDNQKASGVMAYYRRVVKETAKTEENQFIYDILYSDYGKSTLSNKSNRYSSNFIKIEGINYMVSTQWTPQNSIESKDYNVSGMLLY